MKPLIKLGWLRALIFIPILFILLSLIVGGVMSVVKIPRGIYLNIFLTFAQSVAVMLAIFISSKFIDRRSVQSFGFNFIWKDFLLGSLLGIVLMTVGTILMAILGWSKFVFQGFDVLGLLKYFVFFVLVSIFEESLIRTYLLDNLMQSMNKYLALAITASIFSFLHFSNPAADWFSTLELFLAGILLGLWYIHRGNIWFPIGLHLTWNYFQGPVFGHEVSGNPIKESIFQQIDIASQLESGGKFGMEGSWIGLGLTYLGCLWIEWYLRREKRVVILQ